MALVPLGWRTISIRLRFGIAFALPHSWTFSSDGVTAQALAPLSAQYFRILDSRTSLSLTAIAKGFAASEIKSLRRQDPQATVAVTRTRLPLGPAAKVVMRYHGLWASQPAEITQVIYFVKNGNHAFEFDFGAPSASRRDQALFETIVKTVQFLSLSGAA